METQLTLILVQLIRNETATIALAKATLNKNEYDKFHADHAEMIKIVLDTFRNYFPESVSSL